jgi:hypothetical protein
MISFTYSKCHPARGGVKSCGNKPRAAGVKSFDFDICRVQRRVYRPGFNVVICQEKMPIRVGGRALSVLIARLTNRMQFDLQIKRELDQIGGPVKL